jgi:predicted nuclease with RNAse H fold
MTFDRFDICAAHEAIEIHYNLDGWLHERPSNVRRMEATHVQLHRMGYRSAPTRLDCFDALTDNGKDIYRALEQRYGFEVQS